MKNLCAVTGTRAEYGLLRPLMKRILSDGQLHMQLVVTGMHLCPEFGLTAGEIEADGFSIQEKIEIILSSDTHVGMTKSMGLALVSFAEYFAREKPDMLILLGDRYEIFACACAAAMAGIPIAHLYGGDTTEGAMDEFLRHSITKMSYLHFPSNLLSRRRVIQLGENPDRVFNFGALSVENILNMPLLCKAELEKKLAFSLERDYALVTFHPTTMEDETAKEQVEALLSALEQFESMKFIFTKANSDVGGRMINRLIEDYVKTRENCIAVASLGIVNYLSAMKYAKAVIGNSSSGLYEAPSFHIPTIDIGDRQKGRVKADSVIHCEPDARAIVGAMHKAFSKQWQAVAENTVSPFGDGDTSRKIVATIKEFLFEKKIDLKKKFYGIDFEV